MGELHFLSLFADHHQQHGSEHDPRPDQHLPVRQPTVSHECEGRDDERQGAAGQDDRPAGDERGDRGAVFERLELEPRARPE